MSFRSRAGVLLAIAALLVGAGVLQARLEAMRPAPALETAELYVRSAPALDRAALSFDALLADVYWMRAIQHFGGVRRSNAVTKRYDLLFPLLDLTTSLDPHFTAPYLFGAIFLAEPQPGGAGRPDQAVALLRKGLEAEPDNWRFAEQIGFVYYWYSHDFDEAANWFARAAAIPGAPVHLKTLEASTRAEGGDLETSRRLWQRLIETAESDWMRETARFRLAQVETYAAIDRLQRIVADFAAAEGSWPGDWSPIIRSGRLRGVPVDAAGTPFVLSPSGQVTVADNSPLHPLPQRPGGSVK